jgi:hypothetical protein
MTTQERSLIDRYIDNSLSGVELKEFMDKLEQDENFRKQVSFHNLLIESIQIAEDARLEKSIVDQIGYKKPLIPSGLKLILTFLFITAIGITLWQYLGTGTLQTRKRIFSWDLFKNNNTEKEKEKSADVVTNSVKVKEVVETPTTEEKNLSEFPSEASHLNTDSTVSEVLSEEENVVVKQDQLLVTHTLRVTDIEIDDSKKPVDNSLSQSTANKLNPSGGLVENPKSVDDNYEVEFWLSPVNYKGYKLASNKLVLFGIEEPDAVKLYFVEDRLMMKYGQNYFRLNPSDEFIAFSTIKNTDLPAVLK